MSLKEVSARRSTPHAGLHAPICALLASIAAASTCLCAEERYQASEPHMGTLVTIILYTDSAEHAQRAFVSAFGRIEQLNSILSDYLPDSELSRVCDLKGPLSPDLLKVLSHSQEIARQTGGAFDVTVGPLTRLWRSARKRKRLPEDAAIREALSHSGYRNLEVSLSERRVQCLVSGMHIDAGGIAKGYAADQALAALRISGVPRALVALSGDIACGDPPPGAAGWKVDVSGQTRILSRKAVSTSGDEFQALEVGTVRYSHILDPRTGMALQNSRTVSVIADTGTEADALATAISVGEPALAESMRARPGVEILIH